LISIIRSFVNAFQPHSELTMMFVTNTSIRGGLFKHFSLIAIALLFGTNNAAGEVSLKTIIDNVSTNESLYDEIDVRLVETYRDHDPGTFTDPNVKVITAREQKTHFVGQKGMFHLETRSAYTYANQETASDYRLRLFDSNTTRMLEADRKGKPGIANLIEGRSDDSEIVRPHMLLLRQTREFFPLSTYLQGRTAIEAYPNASLGDGLELDIQYQGEKQYKNLRCHIVSITTMITKLNKPHDRWVLWLAEEKNFIPVREEGYTFRYSKDLPVGIGEVTQWQELKPGVWFPTAATVKAYDMEVVRQEGKSNTKWESHYQLTKVSLEPKYNAAFFRDLEIPIGTMVYKISDKKIVESYRQEPPKTHAVKQ
jgi:hypothetical protein